MMFNTSKWFYNTTVLLGIALSSIACNTDPTPMPTEELVIQTTELDPIYQLIYDTHAIKTPDSNQQRVRILLWLKRMNCNVSQLQKLDELRKIAMKNTQIFKTLKFVKHKRHKNYTLHFSMRYDSLRTGAELDDTEVQESVQTFQSTISTQEESPSLDVRLETIKSILDAEEDFLRSLSPEQESTIVDAIYIFCGTNSTPLETQKDFSLLIGNTFEPGQYAILLKGTSELAQQSGNIGGLWSDQQNSLDGFYMRQKERSSSI